ncbi:hypothetical protein ACH5RR_037737 [Cinchona calisaya]|uniref:DUF4220 domain-containing protein n=1 Tax=Cinchona calisaya TaxID=153742 RepID=A0ABD2Y8D3_9GENT
MMPWQHFAFLLLHLGGPDAITAFSLEDNGLWIRHLLGLMVQLLAVAYIISQSIPNDFWIPTVLVFLAGFIKYAERTRAVYLACLVNFKDYMRSKPDPEPDYAELRQEYVSRMKAIKMLHIPEKRDTYFGMEDIVKLCELDEIKILLRGYRFYNIFKGLIVDNVFSHHERNHSRMYFFKLTPQAAFRLMEVELNFMYDALYYTKMAAVHNGIFGYIFRFFCNATVVATFVLFTSHPSVRYCYYLWFACRCYFPRLDSPCQAHFLGLDYCSSRPSQASEC